MVLLLGLQTAHSAIFCVSWIVGQGKTLISRKHGLIILNIGTLNKMNIEQFPLIYRNTVIISQLHMKFQLLQNFVEAPDGNGLNF